MNRNAPHNDDSWEHDPVWKLLDQAPPATARGRFADDTVRAARLASQPAPWWKLVLRPLPIASLAAATAAVAIAVTSWNDQVRQPDTRVAVEVTTDPHADEIADIAETEALIAAVDHIDEFSDNELVSLIGF